MARSWTSRLAAFAFSNILIPVAVLVFASGFFPYKPVLPGLATFDDAQEHGTGEAPVFDRVVFMVVDALRSDFVYGHNSGFQFTQSLIRSGAAIPFTAHATPPTVTMPRVKALTTGSVPSFLDLILNFAESDTTSSLATQDTWLAQIRAKGGRLVFYGDDTWLKLFPGDFFARADGTSSFFVSDFTEVDLNVTRHVPAELARDDWEGMIMHYLGLDHIGHKTGPNGPNMLPKQREMDGIVRQIYEAMETHAHQAMTLLVVAGDHGMNAGGNHGGSAPGETEPALLFASPHFKNMRQRKHYDCPTLPKEGTEFHYYTKVEQSDIVPALAGLMGFPISKNSLGVFLPELTGILPEKSTLRHLHRNARQMLNIVRAKYGTERFDQSASKYGLPHKSDEDPCQSTVGDEEQLACEWARISLESDSTSLSSTPQTTEKDLYTFLNHAQGTMSDTASSYDIPRMVAGMAIISLALIAASLSFPSLWPPSSASLFFTLICLLYALMMFASSYVEEEQHFWYWLTPAWIVLLVAKGWVHAPTNQRKTKIALAGALLLCAHRTAVRWNQTGQKHAGDADIVHSVFPQYHVLMWLLILGAYVMNGFLLHHRTFRGLFAMEIAAFVETTLVTLAVVFKLNFTQADAPELVQGLAAQIREYTEPFSLVLQARAVFASIAVAAIAVILGSTTWARLRRKANAQDPSAAVDFALPERLHHLLTLFLMTQTRAPNIPLYLILELQRLCLHWLISSEEIDGDRSVNGSGKITTSPVEVATSALLLSNVFYFCVGGSNSISSIDLSNAYNGVADYNIAAVGVLLFASNWAGPIWWCSAAVLLLTQNPSLEDEGARPAVQDGERDWVMVERTKLHSDAVASFKSTGLQGADGGDGRAPLSSSSWMLYVSSMTVFVATSLLAVMAACTALRTHLFIWTVFSPKYLYAMAWSVGWHLIVNVGLGSMLFWLSCVT